MLGLARRRTARPKHHPWKLKHHRLFLVFLVILVLLSPLGIWRIRLANSVNHALSDLRAAGRPTSLEDLNAGLAPIVPQDNGAILFREAAAAFQALSTGDWSQIPYRSDLRIGPEDPLAPEVHALMKRLVSSNQDALALARSGATQAFHRYIVEYNGQEGLYTQAHVVGTEQLTALLCCDAVLSAEAGDIGAAFDSLVAALSVVTTLGHDGLMNSLKSQWIQEEHLLDALQRVMTEPMENTRLQPFRDYFTRAQRLQQWEYLCDVEQCLYLSRISGDGDGGLVRAALLSAGLGDMNRGAYLDLMSLLRAGFDASSEEQVRLQLQYDRIANQIERRPLRYATLRVYQPIRWWAVVKGRWDDIAIAEVGLAVAAYRGETGSYPATLSALAPVYLADVPEQLRGGSLLGLSATADGYQLWKQREGARPEICWSLRHPVIGQDQP